VLGAWENAQNLKLLLKINPQVEVAFLSKKVILGSDGACAALTAVLASRGRNPSGRRDKKMDLPSQRATS
jgi:hypothetical protein